MDNLDVSGILRTYSEKASRAKTTKQLREIVRDVKQEFDLRKIKIDGGNDNGKVTRPNHR